MSTNRITKQQVIDYLIRYKHKLAYSGNYDTEKAMRVSTIDECIHELKREIK